MVTAPPGVTARIALLALSVTIHAPRSLFHAMPEGKKKRALLPMPSVLPEFNEPHKPARKLTVLPSAGTVRMQWLLESATYSVAPVGPSVMRCVGKKNLAEVPSPSW